MCAEEAFLTCAACSVFCAMSNCCLVIMKPMLFDYFNWHMGLRVSMPLSIEREARKTDGETETTKSREEAEGLPRYSVKCLNCLPSSCHPPVEWAVDE